MRDWKQKRKRKEKSKKERMKKKGKRRGREPRSKPESAKDVKGKRWKVKSGSESISREVSGWRISMSTLSHRGIDGETWRPARKALLAFILSYSGEGCVGWGWGWQGKRAKRGNESKFVEGLCALRIVVHYFANIVSASEEKPLQASCAVHPLRRKYRLNSWSLRSCIWIWPVPYNGVFYCKRFIGRRRKEFLVRVK